MPTSILVGDDSAMARKMLIRALPIACDIMQSQVGKGTTFQVWLPITETGLQQAEAAEAPEGLPQQ